MSKKEIYLDHASSSLLRPEVMNFLREIYERRLGNPASIHRSGVLASLELEKAREILAQKINAKAEEIYFTSGATESNNLALRGLALANLNNDKKEIIISNIEHSCVRQTAFDLEKNYGFKIHQLAVNNEGQIDLDELRNKITKNTLLVSIIHANNEIGTLQDLKAIGKICHEREVLFHSDGAQALCKSLVDVESMNLAFYSMSAHKIHGPKGIGALFIKSGLLLKSQALGGNQESGMRSGTVPIELVAAMGKAVQCYSENDLLHLKDLDQYLKATLKKEIPEVQMSTSQSDKVYNIHNFSIPGLMAKDVLHFLDRNGVRVSVGSACHSGKKDPSHVLMALGFDTKRAFETLRVSFSFETTISDIDELIRLLKVAKKELTVTN